MTDRERATLARTLEAAYARYAGHGADPARARLRRESAGAFVRALCTAGGACGVATAARQSGNEVLATEGPGMGFAGVTSRLPAPPERPEDAGGPPHGREERTTNALLRLCGDVMDPRTPAVVAVGGVRPDGDGHAQSCLVDAGDGDARAATHAVRLGMWTGSDWRGWMEVRPVPAHWGAADLFAWLSRDEGVPWAG